MAPQNDPPSPFVSLCVFVYGSQADTITRCLFSIINPCDRRAYKLIVGAHDVSARTDQDLRMFLKQGQIDRLYSKDVNKPPTLQRMFGGIDTEFVWGMEYTSYFLRGDSLYEWAETARAAVPEVGMWRHSLNGKIYARGAWLARNSAIQSVSWPDTEMDESNWAETVQKTVCVQGLRVEKIESTGVDDSHSTD